MKSYQNHLNERKNDAAVGYKQRVVKSRSVFPTIYNDSITMLVFSYLEVFHRSLDILKVLNSKGYDLMRRASLYKHLFEAYQKSQIMCAMIREFQEEEIF